MSKYKYLFFNGRGRGEVTRLIFVYAGVDFEDTRVEPLEWRKHYATETYNEAPVLEVDGIKLCQSDAIAHFVAKRCNLAGKNELEEARSLMLVLTMEDLVTPMFDCYHHIRQDLYPENDESKIPALKKELEEVVVPKQLNKLELLLKENNGGDGFFVGDSLTYADLAWMHNITWANTIKINPKLENFPKLKALRDRVASIPKIAAWNEKWKHCPF